MILSLFVFGIAAWFVTCLLVVLDERKARAAAREREHLINLVVARHAGEAVALTRSREPKQNGDVDERRRKMPSKPEGL